MLERLFGRTEKEINPQKLILSYLGSGSIEEANQELPENEQVSRREFNRILKEWGIVEYVGPGVRFPEIIGFFSDLVAKNLSLDSLYVRRPLSFKTSLDVLRKIYTQIRENIVVETATATLISPIEQPDYVVIGEDFSIPRPWVGKLEGCWTIPACFSVPTEEPKRAIMRTLQREAFSKLVIEKRLSMEVIPDNPELIAEVDVAHVRTEVFRMFVPDDLLEELSSPTILRLRTCQIREVLADENRGVVRAGIREAISEYERFLVSEGIFKPRIVKSELNRRIAQLSPIKTVPSLRWA